MRCALKNHFITGKFVKRKDFGKNGLIKINAEKEVAHTKLILRPLCANLMFDGHVHADKNSNS